jgi:hypothetical protein
VLLSKPNRTIYGPDGQDRDTERLQAQDELYEQAERIEERHGEQAAKAYLEVALGEVTPIRMVADRWQADIKGIIRGQTAQQHERALALLGEFLAGREGPKAEAALTETGMEDLTRRRVGEFVEWLQQEQGKELSAKTTGRIVSSLSRLWGWARNKGLTSSDSPWSGQTEGRQTFRPARTTASASINLRSW